MAQQQTKTNTKHMVTTWIDTKLYSSIKTMNPQRGAIAIAINEGLKLYLEKQLQQEGSGK